MNSSRQKPCEGRPRRRAAAHLRCEPHDGSASWSAAHPSEMLPINRTSDDAHKRKLAQTHTGARKVPETGQGGPVCPAVEGRAEGTPRGTRGTRYSPEAPGSVSAAAWSGESSRVLLDRSPAAAGRHVSDRGQASEVTGSDHRGHRGQRLQEAWSVVWNMQRTRM